MTPGSPGEHIAIGYQPCGPRAVRFDILERLADMIRDARTAQAKGQFALTPDMTALLGCNLEDLRGILGSLDYRRLHKGKPPGPDAGEIWMRRRRAPRAAPAAPAASLPDADNPFSALASLSFAPPPGRHAAASGTKHRKRGRPPRQKASS